jgi:steroid delta-isomerase-like uncharacterized protein
MRSVVLPLVSAALVLAGCAAAPNAQLEANKALARQFIEATNAADWAAYDRLLAPDFQRHSEATPGPPVTSPQQFVELQTAFLATAPDQHVTVDVLVAEGDRVAILATYSGTQTGPMNDLPATGKPFRLQFLGMLRIADHRIAEMWVEWDNVALLSQLGLFPPPSPAGS